MSDKQISLTQTKNIDYATATTAKSVVSISMLFNTSAKALTRSAFFMPTTIMVGCIAALRSAVPRVGNANAVQPATQLISINSGSSQLLHEDTTMSAITIASKSIRQRDGLYLLNDLHKASGKENKHSPRYFLKLQGTQELIKEIEKDGIPSFCAEKGTGSYAHKYLVYAYAMWISPKFHLHVIKAFDQQQTEVIKQIPQIKTNCDDPDRVCMPKEYLDMLYATVNESCAAYNAMAKDFIIFKDRFFQTHDKFIKLNATNELTKLSPTFNSKVKS